MKLRPIETKKAYMEIIEQIKQLINSGTLKPGEKLPPERELVEQFGVSRSTVREALSALEIVGLVESKPGEGRFINNSSGGIDGELIKQFIEDSVPFELLEARITIETGIATIAADKADNDDLLTLETVLRRMEGIALDSTDTIEDELNIDSDFHYAIAEMTGNKFLMMTMDTIAESMKDQLWITLKRRALANQEIREKYLKDHQLIFKAIESNSSNQAGRLMRQHLLTVWSDLLRKD